jgi:predicted nuclease of predicted toxin-antitoxin system
MTVALYMNQHVPRAITVGLRLRGVDVITAHEDGASQMEDPELLDRASELERVLFTQDDDLLAEAARRQAEGIPFRGVIYAHQLRVPIGICVRDLEIIGKAAEPKDLSRGVLATLKKEQPCQPNASHSIENCPSL